MIIIYFLPSAELRGFLFEDCLLKCANKWFYSSPNCTIDLEYGYLHRICDLSATVLR